MYYVRDARHDEITRLVTLSEKVMQESTYAHMHFDHDKVGNYIVGAILKQPGWFLRVIAEHESDDAVGGLICLTEISIFGRDKMAYDVTIMIDEEHRGKCLKQLIQMVHEYRDWAIKEGAKVIKFGVSSGINIDKASVFFERMGFARIGAMHGVRVGV